MSQRFASAAMIYFQPSAPDQSSDYVPLLGNLWIDQSQSPPLVKKCVAVLPFVWASIEGGGGGAINFSDGETPSGSITGTSGSDGNATFTLAHPPVATPILEKNGQVRELGVAYTLTGSTITYLAPFIPVVGDTHKIWYRY